MLIVSALSVVWLLLSMSADFLFIAKGYIKSLISRASVHICQIITKFSGMFVESFEEEVNNFFYFRFSFDV